MNIQAEKLELVRLILDTDNPEILSSVKQVFSNANNLDFWDALPQYQKDEILLAIEELDKGEFVSYDDFIKKHK